jgi:hypothetical protein
LQNLEQKRLASDYKGQTASRDGHDLAEKNMSDRFTRQDCQMATSKLSSTPVIDSLQNEINLDYGIKSL